MEKTSNETSMNIPKKKSVALLILLHLVTLKIYDVLGRKVAVLVNEEKPSGTYEVNFDASKLSSGLYVYRLTADNFVSVKKMTLLK